MRRFRRAPRFAAAVIVALVFALGTLWLFRQELTLPGLGLSVTLAPFTSGQTVIAIPPLGEISAPTHRAPIKVFVRLDRVDLQGMEDLFSSPVRREGYLEKLETGLRDAVPRFLVQAAILMLVGALIGAHLFAKGRQWVYAGLLGTAGAYLLPLALFLGYDPTAFNQPSYSGILRAAPAFIGQAEKSLDSLEDFRGKLRLIAGNLRDFYGKVETWEPLKLADGKVLTLMHVSDIHNNPAAFDLMRHLIRTFDVKAVLDSGDLTDFGTPIEAGVVRHVGSLQVPYYIVIGNHDSPDIARSLSSLPNVRILDGEDKVVGLAITGFPDPAGKGPFDARTDPAQLRKGAEQVQIRLASRPDYPFFLLVHERQLAEKVLGKVPVVLVGHSHRESIKRSRGSLVLDAGTTGGAGIRNFTQSDEVPLSLHLLHIDPEEQKLLAVDRITFGGAGGAFSLSRKLANGSTHSGKKQANEISPVGPRNP